MQVGGHGQQAAGERDDAKHDDESPRDANAVLSLIESNHGTSTLRKIHLDRVDASLAEAVA